MSFDTLRRHRNSYNSKLQDSIVKVFGSAPFASKTTIIRTCRGVVEIIMLRLRALYYYWGEALVRLY